ncbi:hypothetical protein [Prosthecomicrobium pneumaticum]|uniref:Uncharacterized protein n=1 Tax=Prosthecomicrobium pneumaticum TaxID=81895 RepID=A0A7W9FPS2_9HYPH|nr:hypothetical protein [Prosthecomicrobium pneumaticum]MBB5754632.1 hypothetical protein [Prosthecomicrobium pneumaticum]
MSERAGRDLSLEAQRIGDFWARIRTIEAAGDIDGSIRLLLGECDLTEQTDERMQWGVAPAPYWRLAILYRRRKQFADELAILERYDRQRKAPGSMPARLADRLQKVRTRNARLAP